MGRHRRNYDKSLRTDFSSDTSRWEFSVLIDLASRTRETADLLSRANATLSDGPAPERPSSERVLAVLYAAACQILPSRSKHDQTRSGLPYLLRRSIDALAAVGDAVAEQDD